MGQLCSSLHVQLNVGAENQPAGLLSTATDDTSADRVLGVNSTLLLHLDGHSHGHSHGYGYSYGNGYGYAH
eukprot:11191429-Lingulodinium_polyedra.AAC.1